MANETEEEEGRRRREGGERGEINGGIFKGEVVYGWAGYLLVGCLCEVYLFKDCLWVGLFSDVCGWGWLWVGLFIGGLFMGGVNIPVFDTTITSISPPDATVTAAPARPPQVLIALARAVLSTAWEAQLLFRKTRSRW